MGYRQQVKAPFIRTNFLKTHIRINLDMLKTRSREDVFLHACIKAKQPFVVDNTNPSIEDRKKYIDIAKSAKFKVIGYYFQSSIAEAIKKNERREGKEHIPLAGIKGTHAKLQLPGLDEGFDVLYYVKINEENKFVVEEWKNEI